MNSPVISEAYRAFLPCCDWCTGGILRHERNLLEHSHSRDGSRIGCARLRIRLVSERYIVTIEQTNAIGCGLIAVCVGIDADAFKGSESAPCGARHKGRG